MSGAATLRSRGNQVTFERRRTARPVPPRLQLSPRAVRRAHPRESVDSSTFLDAMSLAVTGVSIVTTDGVAGRFGITVSAVASLSADPPLVLASINQRSPACAAVRENGVFCINLLSTQQQELADTFAGRPTHGEPFDFRRPAWSPGTSGSPHFDDAVATFDCVLEQTHEAGSHTLFIGRVVEAIGSTADPLLYTRRAYGRPCR